MQPKKFNFLILHIIKLYYIIVVLYNYNFLNVFFSVVTRMPKITKKRFNKHFFSANNISISLNTLKVLRSIERLNQIERFK